MNDLAIGRSLRVLRTRRRLRQVDVARRAQVSQQLISKVERGRLASLSTGTLRRIFAGVDADVITIVRWRGGELDRLLDEGHAELVGRIVTLLRRRGWEVLTEVSFSDFGDRGSIDVLAWHPATRTILVVEVKTEITSAEEMLRRHDVKVRLAPKIGRDRFGAIPARVGRLLVVADSTANRQRVGRLAPVLDVAYPGRGSDVRAWIARPDGDLRALMFTARSLSGSRSAQPSRRVPGIGRTSPGYSAAQGAVAPRSVRPSRTPSVT